MHEREIRRFILDKRSIDKYLSEVAKQYRKLIGKKMRAEIILVGGAAVAANYSFRDTTTDIDAYIQAASCFKDAVNAVTDKHHLPNNWLNDDFLNTESFSVKIREYSTYYRTFSNVLEIRTIKGEYLIAMKLRAGRTYKYDLSDIVGILREHKRHNSPISMDMVKAAYRNLYGDELQTQTKAALLLDRAIHSEDDNALYNSVRTDEERAGDVLDKAIESYPDEINRESFRPLIEIINENLSRTDTRKSSIKEMIQQAKDELAKKSQDEILSKPGQIPSRDEMHIISSEEKGPSL